MHFFTTYYHNVQLSIVSFKEEIFAVNKILHENPIEHFFKSNEARTLICSTRINELEKINERLRQINQELKIGEYYVGHFETYSARRARMKINRFPFFRSIYFFFTFIFHRIVPRMKVINKLYFFITKGKNRLISKAEVLGRLVYNGFEIVQVEQIDGLTYFKVRKSSQPKMQATSYGFIFKMERVGKDGKLFNVYKFRTMHPFSEYLQDFMIQQHGLGPKGKIDRDFRVTPWGKWMRKYWFDELPQLFNVLLGQMKLVGVRPVSKVYFDKLPVELQKQRVKRKPGCIPPYVAMNQNSDLKSVLDAEIVYLKEKDKHPYYTDLKYFFFASINILFKGKRSS